jgi:hypothetical protein
MNETGFSSSSSSLRSADQKKQHYRRAGNLTPRLLPRSKARAVTMLQSIPGSIDSSSKDLTRTALLVKENNFHETASIGSSGSVLMASQPEISKIIFGPHLHLFTTSFL